MKAVKITTTFIGVSNSGTFSIYTNADSYASPVETGITKIQLNAGYTSLVIPNTATKIKLYSNSFCGALPTDGETIVPYIQPSPTPTPTGTPIPTPTPVVGNGFISTENNDNVADQNNDDLITDQII
jgi:hypothetical protein